MEIGTVPVRSRAATTVSAVSAIALAALASVASAQLPFFPGAEGFGSRWSGTAPAGGWLSNAAVYHVTNLNDSGPGSFRGAFQENSTNKIIVFDVAGTIQLTSNSLDIKNLSNYYIAGQTAPGPVTIYGDTTQITHSSNKTNNNVILRYLSFRKGAGDGEDSITFAGGNATGVATNMILDHVSASWSEDEILSVTNYNTNVTVQYSIISDALVSGHAYGSLLRPRISSSVTFHHNLYAHNASRQARFGTYNGETLTADFRNNVVYNWRDRASYAGGSSEDEQEFVDVNVVGNYFIAGPGTGGNTTKSFIVDKNVDVRAYQAGNFVDSDKSLNPSGQPNGTDTGWNQFAFNTPVTDQSLVQIGTPFDMPPVTTQSANDAYWQLINHVGNWWWNRDAIDGRVINNVLTNTGPTIGPSAPPSGELNGLLSAPMLAHPAGYDADNDGMEDEWEAKHGGNLVWNADFDNDGYINLIEFINETGEFPAPAPIVFNGSLNNRYAHIMNWKTDDGGITAGSNWQPSKYDVAQINSGTAVMDAVGQNAGLLKIASHAADVAALDVTAGWLDVNGSLVAGVEGTGTVSQTGGLVIADQVLLGAEAGATGTYNLSNGVLRTASLEQGDGSADFHFTGGILSADDVGFNIENQGGMISPGSSIGQSRFRGDLTLTSGMLAIELTSSTESDTLLVDGQVMLGGSLDVSLLGDFTPQDGNGWQIITAGGIMGEFSSITPGYAVQQQGNNLMLFFGNISVPILAGDYNNDGVVDAADYTVWRNSLASGTPLVNETASPGIVDAADYQAWKANFGATGSGNGASAIHAVPEPATWLLVLLGSAPFWTARVRRGLPADRQSVIIRV